MPFVTQPLRVSSGGQLPFVGRAAELRFFREQILMPDEPAAHLLNVWGPPGTGVSTLLLQWREEARAAPLAIRPLSAFANGRMSSPLRIMTAYAAQLRAAGTPLLAFEQLLAYMTITPFRSFPAEQQIARTLFARRVQALAHARPVQGVPVIGGMYEAVSQANRTAFLQQHPALQIHQWQTFQEQLAVLTRAFVDDLNWLSATPARDAAGRGQRILLFLDEVSTVAGEVLTWLRAQVLPAPISSQVVLVLAGPASLEPELALEPAMVSLPVQPFTREETRAFLSTWEITDPARISSLWQRTGGLPLALLLLAPVPPDWLRPDEEAIAAGLRWIEQQAPGYRYLVRYAALFSTAFRPRDLAVCSMFSAQECLEWSRVLSDLPFVEHHPVTGEQTYHPLVQHQVRQGFARDTLPVYQQALRALARHYQRQFDQLRRQQGAPVFSRFPSQAEQELVSALLTQWFWIADGESLRQAIEWIVEQSQQTADQAVLTSRLRALARLEPGLALPEESKRLAICLLAYSEADLEQPATLTALTELVAYVEARPAFSATTRARLYARRAATCLAQNQPRPALEYSTQATTLDPTFADALLLQGLAFAVLGQQTEAITAYTHALALDHYQVFAYAHRALAHRTRRAYEQAVEDANQVMTLAPEVPQATALYGLVYGEMDEKRRNLGNFDDCLARDPRDTQAYALQGMAHCVLGQHEQALTSFARALALDSADPWLYAGRSHVYLEEGDLEQARADLTKSWELDTSDGTIGLLLAWVQLCLQEPDTQVRELLETLAGRSAEPEISLICRGIMYLLQQQVVEALDILEQAYLLHPRQGNAAFWKGFVCACLEQDAEALAALAQARNAEIPLPTVLFTPLRRLASTRPAFYRAYLLPFLSTMSPVSPRDEL